jgi:hypothetical protein
LTEAEGYSVILKPCPFCGGPAEAGTDAYRERFINNLFGFTRDPAAKNAWIFCTVCGAVGQKIEDTEYDGFKDPAREAAMIARAADAWNHREGETA